MLFHFPPFISSLLLPLFLQLLSLYYEKASIRSFSRPCLPYCSRYTLGHELHFRHYLSSVPLSSSFFCHCPFIMRMATVSPFLVFLFPHTLQVRVILLLLPFFIPSLLHFLLVPSWLQEGTTVPPFLVFLFPHILQIRVILLSLPFFIPSLFLHFLLVPSRLQERYHSFPPPRLNVP